MSHLGDAQSEKTKEEISTTVARVFDRVTRVDRKVALSLERRARGPAIHLLCSGKNVSTA